MTKYDETNTVLLDMTRERYAAKVSEELTAEIAISFGAYMLAIGIEVGKGLAQSK